MMARFWLATFDLEPPVAAMDPAVAPIQAAGTRMLAIEVVRNEESEFAVLFSKVDDPQKPEKLTCLIGFTNAAKACSIWHDRGFPLVDAKIDFSGEPGAPLNTLSIISPYFRDKDAFPYEFDDKDAMQYESRLLGLTGIQFEKGPDQETTLSTLYEQTLEAPDGAQPDILITRRAVTWTPERSYVRSLSPLPHDFHLDLVVGPTRYPSLAPLKTDKLSPVSVWSGEILLPLDEPEKNRGPFLGRVSRADTYGLPAFRFENVEVLGFRVDLAAYGRDFEQDLARLIEPLNFHLDESSSRNAISDFRYRAATGTLVIELLRYGGMKLKTPLPPLGMEEYQSQHELVVRLLVGRVNDDTAQAHAPAVYVPAIFVDNPWSKVLGRDLQGFDKRMANFCVRLDSKYAPLRPDGRIAGPRVPAPAGAGPGAGNETPEPLANISRISLVKETGSSLEGERILELDCSPAKYENWNAFENIDLDLALGSFSLTDARWRQSDFDDAEFRRSFARAAVTRNLKGFRSIQVSPVTNRGLDRTWITGKFEVDDDIRIARPSGVASLTLFAVPNVANAPAPSTPASWNRLCKMLGDDGKKAEISFPTGSWYRLKCSMDLTIDDGLDWIGPDS